MSQEEIEALMSGADDIQVDEVEENIAGDELNIEPESVENIDPDEDINVDDILAGIDGIVDEEDVNVDDILAGIDGVVDEPNESKDSEVSEMESKINNNQYPLPASDENKVVNQLNEVADDSEEKASQIFDVLSFILDENAEISKYNKNMSEFITQQSELLESLSIKFPNVDIFTDNLTNAKQLIETSNELSLKVDAENNKVFEAMELMQYHDINRQKIERVMAVIKKLSSYLNGIFEDDSGKAEVQIAKHISGDSNDIVDSDDIESLISEFSAN
ncbi:hypothetical protein OAR97_00865 [Arcobacteraceae bacterium]|nr:hypothetical protein [Arcobacteraceae bacterium]